MRSELLDPNRRRKIATMKAIVLGMLVLLPTVAGADILSWQDADGVRHYTNLQAEVPKEHRESATVVVDETARHGQDAPASAAGEVASRDSDTPRQAQVVYDRSQVSEAYLEGLRRGLEVAGAINTAGGSVQISGPLAIANATSPTTPYDVYPYPLVTTSFDRGRSRHLTLRQLLQDQFAIDRDSPFFFEERFIPPFGHAPLTVDLNPFLPRGLPHGFPRQARVITH